MRLCLKIFIIILLLFLSNAISGAQLLQDNLTIVLPENWPIKASNPPIIFIAKAITPENGTPLTDAVPYYHYQNIVITCQEMTNNQKSLYDKDPSFYLQVTLYQTYPTLAIYQIDKRTINRFSGVYIKNIVEESNLRVGNIQFLFLIGDRLYGVAFSCLSQTLEKNSSIFKIHFAA